MLVPTRTRSTGSWQAGGVWAPQAGEPQAGQDAGLVTVQLGGNSSGLWLAVGAGRGARSPQGSGHRGYSTPLAPRASVSPSGQRRNGAALGRRVLPTPPEGSPRLTLQAAGMELQVELGLGLCLQGGVARQELDLPLAVPGPGACSRWEQRFSCSVPGFPVSPSPRVSGRNESGRKSALGILMVATASLLSSVLATQELSTENRA